MGIEFDEQDDRTWKSKRKIQKTTSNRYEWKGTTTNIQSNDDDRQSFINKSCTYMSNTFISLSILSAGMRHVQFSTDWLSCE